MSKVNINFSDLINASITWTKTILFRPFKFKKWLMLFIIAALALQLQGGCNSNIRLPGSEKKSAEQKYLDSQDKEIAGETKSKVRAVTSHESPVQIVKNLYGKSVKNFGKTTVYLLVVLLCLVLILLVLLSYWVYSIFSFIYIEAIVNNDTSIKAPFKRNVQLGKSYFIWTIISSFISYGSIMILIKLGYNSLLRLGVFESNSQIAFVKIILSVLPFILIGMCLFIASWLLGFFVTNYILIVMYKEKISTLKAFPIAFSLLRDNISTFIIYILIKLGLVIVTSIIGSVVGLLMILTLAIPGILMGIAGFGLFKILPVFLKPILSAVLIILGIPLFIAFFVLMNMILLPFSVFFKTFNIKFIARLDERYNLFKLTT